MIDDQQPRGFMDRLGHEHAVKRLAMMRIQSKPALAARGQALF
ncbi:MAG: hypothetical protein ACREQ4_09775 [Candidatus Binataceae bacterium]